RLPDSSSVQAAGELKPTNVSVFFSLRKNDALLVQPAASVTVTVYNPAAVCERSSVTAPSFHWKVYGVAPPLTEISIEPFVSLQSGSTRTPVILICDVPPTVNRAVAAQLFLSFTVTAY